MEIRAMGLIPERHRWKVWGWLTNLRQVCPANAHSLLIWGYKRDPRIDGMCRRDCAENGFCWCGKLGSPPR